MKSLLLIILPLFLLVACNDTSKPGGTETSQPAQITSTEYLKTEGNCDSACARFYVRYPVAAGNEALNTALQNWTQTFVTGQMYQEDTVGATYPLDSAANRFIAMYKEDVQAGFAEYGFEFEVKDSVLLNNGKVLTLREDAYVNVGGAHPVYFSQISSFDPATGNVIGKEKLIADEAGILKLLEAEYRSQKKEAFDNGFEFDEGVITFPQNLGVVENGILFHYNVYEIAAYAIGDADIVLTWEQMGKMAKEENWK